MKLTKLARMTGYSPDMARRRVNKLAKLGVISRTKIKSEKGRWDYGEDAVEALRTIARYERRLDLNAPDALRRYVEEKLGEAPEEKPAGKLEAELAELQLKLTQRDREIRTLHAKVKDLKARHLPVEREPWHRRFLALVRRIVGRENGTSADT